VPDIRVNDLPVLAAPTDGDVLHAIDDGDDKDKQLTVGALKVAIQSSVASAAQGAKADTALQPGSVDLAYLAPSRVITNTAGDGVTLPLVTTTAAGLTPQSGGGTLNYLRADLTWAPPPAAGAGTLDELSDVVLTSPATDQVLKFNGASWVNAAAPGGGGGTVTSVTGGAGLTGSVTTTGALGVGAGTGITVNADDVAINRTVVDTWYATAAQGVLAGTGLQPGQAATPAQGAKADTALQPGSVDLGYTAATRTITNTGGDAAVLPLVSVALAGLAPASGGGTSNFLRADGTWAAPAGGAGTVTAVSGTVPIDVATGTTTPVVSIRPASGSAAGSMSLADFTKLAAVAPGATANSTDAQLRDRATHTGTQTAVTISDFTASSRAQVEGALTAGTNVTLTPSGTGATRSVQISATAGGGGVSTVTGTAPIVSSGGGSPAISINPASGSAPGSMSLADFNKLAGIANGATANSPDATLLARANHTGSQAASTISDFTASSRAQVEGTLTAGTNVTLTPTGSGATRSIAISATAGGGGVAVVTGTAPIVSSGGGSPAISITAATGSVPGSMSAADFTKLAAITGTNTGDNAVNSLYSGLVTNANHTGDATGATALTLATVNANVGAFGSATQVATFTVNAKGLTTAAASVTITPAVGSITGLGTGVGTALAVNTGSAGAVGVTVAKGTAALGTAAIASGANATTVTVAAAGVAITDVIDWGFQLNPNAVTGYNAALTTGCLVITCFPTAGNVNFVISNPTAASITPGALTLNWTVMR
jgi:hypothetical protein